MDEFGQMLFTELKAMLPVCNLSLDRKEIVIRCKYCGDSVKSSNSSHFYIQSYMPYYCYCQKCNTKTSVGVEFLEDFSLTTNPNLKLVVMKMEKERKFNLAKGLKVGSNNFIESVLNTSNFQIPLYKGTKGELRRLEYINNRLGLSLSLSDAINLGIVLNFKEFISLNKITIDQKNIIRNINEIQKNSVGFLSQDKNFLQFRMFNSDEVGYRYINWNINKKHDNKRKFFTIRQPLNLLNPKVKIVITEGTFDILSVYFNIYNQEKNNENIIFASTNGLGMNSVINNVCRLGFLQPEVEIYGDNGVPITLYENIKKSSPFLHPSLKLKIFTNKLSKDVGVPKSEIDLRYFYI